MTITPETVTRHDVLALTRYLSDDDRRWLVELLSRFDDAPLPEQTTLEEAVSLYLADACSLGRAAELAGVTRWEIIEYLKKEGIPIFVHNTRSAHEIDAFAEELAGEGILS